ncbi:ABC transporter permease [Actinomadura sp. 21ATH]|uniref:ABC transporter permease n=1 Tax=Actinomadura sp. 21ATH TaxID=1735444 RepID=UPI0035BF6788
MRTALLITAKDLRQRTRDLSLPMYALLLPLALAFVFDLTMGAAANGERFRYVVADADGGPAAARFVDAVLRPAERAGVLELRTARTAEEARRIVGDGDAAAAFVVPAGFSAQVAAGRAAELEVIGSAESTTGTQVARSLATAYAAEVRAVRLAVAVAAGGRPDPARAGELAARAGAVPAPVAVEARTAADHQLSVATYMAAGMAVFFLFFTVQFGVTGLLEERANGTMPRLLAAPVRPVAVLAGKMLTSVLVGLASMAVLVAATTLLLGASWGDPLGVALLVAAGVLAATGVMAILAAVARTPEQAAGWQAAVAVSLGALGGAFFPIAQVGGIVAALGLLTPHRWFMRGLADLAGGAGAAAALPATGALLLFAAATGGPALLLLGRTLRP